MSDELPPQALLFASDDTGKVTHLRGVELPPQLFHSFASVSLTERSPIKETAWVVRGIYKFARRVQGKSIEDKSAENDKS